MRNLPSQLNWNQLPVQKTKAKSKNFPQAEALLNASTNRQIILNIVLR